MPKTAAAKQPKTKAAVTITLPELAKGEHLAGLILQKGAPSHFVILLPGELERGTWSQAKIWAKKQGGELPTRREQSLLFANAGEHFQPSWYWSGEQLAGSESCAWFQDFYGGGQGWGHVSDSCRARAVRRVSI